MFSIKGLNLSTNQQRLQQLLSDSNWKVSDKEWLLWYIENTDAGELRALMLQWHNEELSSGNKIQENMSHLMWEHIAARTGVNRSSTMAPLSANYPTAHRVHFLKASWFRYAAAVILMLGAGTYLWFTNTKNEVAFTNDNKRLQTDIAPGSDRAILTLSDGSTIVLENAKKGAIAQQGNTKVIKLTNGQLAYNVGNTLNKETLYNIVTTKRGDQYRVTLPDGSKVWLNAASSIKFPTAFTGTERIVEITGEVYIEVAKSKEKPFTATANGTAVKVLGTSFNMNAYKDEGPTKTTLVEGSVKVIKGNKEVTLNPGQQAMIADNNNAIKVTDNTDIEQTLAWKNGLFQFKGADIATIMRQISRWYDVEVSYESKVPARRLTGELPRNIPLSSLLKALELNGIHFRVENRNIIVLP